MPLSTVNLTKEDLADPSLLVLNQLLEQICTEVNRLGGTHGRVTLLAGLDLGGNTIINLGEDKTNTTAAVNTATANTNYGSAAIQTAMEATGTKMLQTARRLNDQQQREQYSSFLNDTLSTPPAANGSSVTFAVIDPTHTEIVVTASQLKLADGTIIPYISRSDTVTNPTSVAIDVPASNGAVRVSGTTTIQTVGAHGLLVGQLSAVANVTDSSFNGTFPVLSVPDATHFTYQQVAPDAASGNGTASLGGVYYYFLANESDTLSVIGPFTADTSSNRIQANTDGRGFVAVAVVTASGGSETASGGGGQSGPGCTEFGTSVTPFPGEVLSTDLEECEEWIDVELANGVKLSFARGTMVEVFVPVEKLTKKHRIGGNLGMFLTLKSKKTRRSRSIKQKVRAYPSGKYLAGGPNGVVVHNAKIVGQ